MTIGGIITAIVFGAIIGAVARLIVPGKQNMPIWLTIAVGIVAALLGSAVARMLDLTTKGFNFWEVLFQIGLAVVGVLLVTALWPKTSSRPHH